MFAVGLDLLALCAAFLGPSMNIHDVIEPTETSDKLLLECDTLSLCRLNNRPRVGLNSQVAFKECD